MLTISKPLSSSQAQTYHAKEFTSAEQNYWKQGDTILGEWQGRMAEQYGLAGGIDAQHFARLSEGQNPLTGEQLVRHRNGHEYTTADGTTVKPVEHRAGWDATFSAPKSVSLTALVGGDDRVREAHREAVTTALTELERYTQARIGGNHAAETTGKFVAAKFEHDTARPVDGYAAPQLHTHAVIFNMTERADGSIRAVQPQSYFDSQQFATAVYQSELMYRLTQLGYEIAPGRSGAPEIKGYTQEYLDASSPRSQQIREYLEKSGFAGPEAAQIAAHTTRDKKEIHTPSEVLAAHRQVAAEFGNQADRVVQEARDRANSIERKPLPAAVRVQEAVTFAKSRNFEREAVTDERDIMRDALRRGMGDLTHSQVRGHFEQRVTSGEFQITPGQKHETGRQFTTREAIAEELSTIKQMQQGRQAAEPIMRQDDAAAHARSGQFLNPAQQRAIEEVLTSQDRIHGLQGLAGSGKTSALSSIREGAEQNGYAVEGFAPTSRAAGQLRDAGIPADTLQGFLARGGVERSSGDPNARHLYMLDESSLASTRQMQSFLEKIGPQDRILLIGDTRQHQGVDAGKPFEQMQEAGMRTSQLDQIVRQKDPELLRAVEHLSRNETATGVQLLQQQGRISEIPDRQQRIEAIATDYVARPENTLIVSPDNASRRDINDAVRAELQNSGALSKENHPMTVLTQRSELTSVDREWAANYQQGDILFYSRGSKEHGIEPRTYAKVASIDAAANRITVAKDDGKQVTYDPKRLSGITAYREISRDFAQGDRIQFTSTNRELGVSNRDLGTITRIDGKQIDLKIDGDKERTVSFDSAKMRHFDHGYTVTSHSSQGLTTDRVLVNMDTTVHPELINTRFAYVSVSRASQDARIYTNDAGNLGERLSTDVTKTSAIDLQKAPTANQQTKEPSMPNTREHPQDDLRREPPTETMVPLPEIIRHEAEVDTRHYAPIEAALPKETEGYEWKRETGDIESYKHDQTGGWLHIDPQGNFYDRQAQPISRQNALEHAAHEPSHSVADNAIVSPNRADKNDDQGISL
ncbi:MobF family relaxase [Granulicella sibirica]|uniref:TraI protein (DNA helicase I) n=1 Tax=Granulicella sibirica TaxID=2479048 RepID=A0A4Q0SX74_9BACT|nr:MobF family relaxase [Granulicella sibirica]RXH55427.1 traI protein (DNA helicase I) [Granulicella sibirica]